MLLTLPPTTLIPGDRIAVAISGGADSTALLLLVHAANALPRAALGVGLSAVHINHSLRNAESDEDQAFVVQLCDRLNIPLHLHTVDTRQRAERNKESLEEAGRNLRYDFFQQLVAERKVSKILTAHTLDDQAETVLMKLLRGAWLEGLSGIAPTLELPATPTSPPGQVLRPLLTTRREDLRTYLLERKQPWREDSSNSDEEFTRSRIRHSVLPTLRSENPAIDHTLANLAELAREEESRWDIELKRVLPQLILPGKPVRGGGRSNSTQIGEHTLALELDRLKALDPALRRRVLRAAARQLGARLTFEETTRLLTLAGFPPNQQSDPTISAKAGTKLVFSQQLVAERSARELRLTTTKQR